MYTSAGESGVDATRNERSFKSVKLLGCHRHVEELGYLAGPRNISPKNREIVLGKRRRTVAHQIEYGPFEPVKSLREAEKFWGSELSYVNRVRLRKRPT